MTDKGAKNFLVLIIFVSLALKILLLSDFNFLPLVGDEYLYWKKCLNTLYNYFHRLDYQAPLYLIYLALHKIIFKDNALLIIRVEQILLQSLEIYLIYLLAKQYFSQKQALISGIIASFYPELVSYSYLLFSEIFFLAFFLSSVFLYFRGLKSSGSKAFLSFIISGVLNGLASLTRSVNFFFFPLIILHLWLFKKANFQNKIACSLLFLLGMFVPLSVQTLKNYRLAHCPLLIDTCAGQNLYRAHNLEPPPHFDFREAHKPKGFARAQCFRANPCQNIRCEFNNALRFIFSHPGLTIKRAGMKIRDLYTPNLFIYKNIFREPIWARISPEKPGSEERLKPYKRIWFRGLGSGSYLLLMLLALLGLFLSGEREFKSFSLLLIFYYTGVCAFFFAHSRFRMPFIPFVIIYAGYFLGLKREDFQNLKSWRIAFALLIWLLFLLLTFPRLQLIFSSG